MSPEFTRYVSHVADLSALRQLALQLASENERLQQEVAELRAELDAAQIRLAHLDPQGEEAQRLRARIAQLQKQVFGRSSERGTTSSGGSKPDKPAARGHGPRPQPRLEVEIVEHELPPEAQVCPECGRKLVPLGDAYDESEVIDVIPRRYVLRKHRWRKYRCVGFDHDSVVTTSGPARLVAGGRYSTAFAVEVAVDKYAFHLPLHRQVQAMKQAGLDATTQALWDQIAVLARLAEPTCRAILTRILAEPLIGADETRWPLLAGGQVQQNRTCYAWCLLGERLVAYRILDDRSADAARQLLRGYKGVVMADGYEVYQTLARGDPDGFVVANCWAHVRRKFVELQLQAPEAAAEALLLIDELFRLERQAQRLSPAARLELRQTQSRPVVEDFFGWVAVQQALPRSGLGEALTYVQNLRPGLERFLADPGIPLHNNACERAQRGLVLGRKNHYGSRSRRGTEVAAIFYTLVESAKLAGADPKAYLMALAQAALADPTTVLLPTDFTPTKSE